MWSFDLIIAVVLFIVVIGIFYAYLSDTGDESEEVKKLSDEARYLSNKLDCDVENSDVCIIEGGVIDEKKVENLTDKDYTKLQDELGVQGDFCIYARDADGNLVPLNGSSGIGDDSFRLSKDLNCSQQIE